MYCYGRTNILTQSKNITEREPGRLDDIYNCDRVVDLIDRFANILHDAISIATSVGVGDDLLAEVLLLAVGRVFFIARVDEDTALLELTVVATGATKGGFGGRCDVGVVDDDDVVGMMVDGGAGAGRDREDEEKEMASWWMMNLLIFHKQFLWQGTQDLIYEQRCCAFCWWRRQKMHALFAGRHISLIVKPTRRTERNGKPAL